MDLGFSPLRLEKSASAVYALGVVLPESGSVKSQQDRSNVCHSALICGIGYDLTMDTRAKFALEVFIHSFTFTPFFVLTD